MRFMVDMSHPAHVHFFRPFIAEMGVRGHQFLIASRKKDITVDLLVAYGLAHQTLSEQRKGAINLAAELILRTARFVHLARSYLGGPTARVSY